MKRIAVFCALPPERNTGMATVDLAAFTRIRALAPGAEVTLYAYGKPNQWAYQKGELPYDHLDVTEHMAPFLASDAFIYWGDFIHTRAYWEQDRGGWDEQTHSMTPQQLAAWQEEQFTQYSRVIFLNELPVERVKKAIVFGSTLITNRAEDELDARYWSHFKSFFSSAGRVLLRDALSAAKVSPLRGSEATLACDCAFLLKPEDLALLKGFTQATDRKGVGVFFGRSPKRANMLRFARALAAEMGEECRWLPWFGTRRRHRVIAKMQGMNIPAGESSPGELLAAVTGCRFIVTDTYHMCVNAWRMGIPAICIGQGGGGTASSLSDKKKEVLYEMYGARSFYVFVESLRGRGLLHETRQAAAALRQEGLSAQVAATVGLHRETAERRLAEALREALA